MALTFTNRYAVNVGIGFTQLYEGPVDEMTYAIVTGMTIANNMLHEITINVRVVDDTNTTYAYLIYESKLSVGSSLCLVGDLQKLILNKGDSIQITASEAGAVDVVMSIIEDDPSISYTGPSFDWFGDFAFITSGESSYDNVSTYTFSSRATASNIGSIPYPYYAQQMAGASDSITGLALGGSGNANEVHTFTFATSLWFWNWSTMAVSLRLFDCASNGLNYLSMGGYINNSTRECYLGDFAQNSVSSFFGNLYNNTLSYFTGATGNSIYAVTLGGYSLGNSMSFFEWASASNAEYWGSMRRSNDMVRAGANEEKAVMTWGDYNSSSIDQIEFATKGNYSWWTNLWASDYEQGAVSNSLETLFTCGESYSRTQLVDMYTQVSATNIGGLASFDGGNPISESGN